MRRTTFAAAALSGIACSLVLTAIRPSALAHCEVPCGIYDDHARIGQMIEDTTTIGKATDQILALEGKHDATSVNQMTRWVLNKEEHATRVQHTIAQYFLTQRVKPKERGSDEWNAYVQRVTEHHAVMVAAMKTKQTVDPNAVGKLRSAIEKIAPYYPPVHAHEHANAGDGHAHGDGDGHTHGGCDVATDLDLLVELTSIPTAAGHEDRVIARIERWVAERDDVEMTSDAAGNLVLGRAGLDDEVERPLYITAHLDHPAFVIEARRTDGLWTASFRGGVRDPYFHEARVQFFDANDAAHGGTILSNEAGKPFRTCTIEFDQPAPPVVPGCIGTWALPATFVEDGLVHAPACDDLAAAAAALDAFDHIRSASGATNVRVLFTRAEEIGLIGATAACRLETAPRDAQMLTLENSRSFAESPIGGGPIVRVGDRLSTFSPSLTGGVAAVATRLAEADDTFRWQRKLMPGGACEATVFAAYGYDATCVCLPLGNYHNMAELERVERDAPSQATVGPEQIAADDYRGLVRLLIACGTDLGAVPDVRAKLDELYEERRWVVEG